MLFGTNTSSSTCHVPYFRFVLQKVNMICSAVSSNVFLLTFLFLSMVHAKVTKDPVVRRSLIGGTVNLPCDVTSPLPKDRMRVVLWYKEDSEIPLYSLDSRSKENPHHSKSETIGNRAHFMLDAKLPYLRIQNLSATDEAMYKCRVDFMKSRTVSHWIKLEIIVPPGPPIITDTNGQILNDQIGPYNEGDPLFLTCIGRTGNPLPMLDWWMNSKKLEGDYKKNRKGDMINELMIKELKREDLHKELMCQAYNNNATVPATKTVILNLNMKPVDVKIVSLRKPMSAGKRVKIQCEATGSRPPALITWWKGSKKMKRTESSSSLNTNLVSSSLKFVPSYLDNGKYLSCRAENPHIPSSAKEDGWTLNVHFKPIAKLHFGTKIPDDRIYEGTDVFLGCDVQANPLETEIQWFHNGNEIFNNPTEKIGISTQTLALEAVTRDKRGNYTCKATNSEGSGYSNSVYLRIQYSPICKRRMKTEYRVPMNKQTTIKCEVDADPPQVSFEWKFVRRNRNVPLNEFKNSKTTSIISYTPESDEDFGMLVCSASNAIVGRSAQCSFHVLLANKPDPVRNCTLLNTTNHLLHVVCLAGSDGGSPQMFQMKVFDRVSGLLKANVTVRENPIFSVSDLPPNLTYDIVVSSENEVGKSSVSFTTQISQKKTASQDLNFKNASAKPFAIRPLLIVLIGVVATLVLIAISFVPMKLRMKSNNRQGSPATDIEEKTYTNVQQENSQCHSSAEKKSPDIVPACIRVTDCGQSEPVQVEDHSYTPFYTEELYETASNKQQDRSRKIKRISWQPEAYEQSLL